MRRRRTSEGEEEAFQEDRRPAWMVGRYDLVARAQPSAVVDIPAGINPAARPCHFLQKNQAHCRIPRFPNDYRETYSIWEKHR